MWNKNLLTQFDLPNLNCKEFDLLMEKISYDNISHYTKDEFISKFEERIQQYQYVSIKGLENPKSVVEKSVCQWYCKWTLEMKDLLFETDNFMKLLQQVKKKVLVSSSSNSATPKTKKKISVATSNSCTSSMEDGIEYNEINNSTLVSIIYNIACQHSTGKVPLYIHIRM